MKINKNKTVLNSKRTAITAVALLCIAGLLITFYLLQNRQADPLKTPINYSPPTSEQADSGEDAKERAINRGEKVGDTQSLPDSDPVSMSATYDNNAKRIVVITKLSNTLTWDKCQLIVTQGSTSKNYEARTVYQPDASFCGGFTVPAENMTGTWNVTLKVSDADGNIYEEQADVAVN